MYKGCFNCSSVFDYIVSVSYKIEKFSLTFIHKFSFRLKTSLIPVSYTHLTLPTNREV